MWLLAEIEVVKVVSLTALVLVCGWLLVRTYGQARRTREPPPLRGLHNGEIETRELVRTLTAQVDSKIGDLERLLSDARRQIQRLEELSQRAARLPAGEGPPSPPADQMIRRADARAPESSALKAGLRVDRPAGRLASPAAGRQEEVFALADAGMTSAAIAARIGSPVGEVELILGLRQTRR